MDAGRKTKIRKIVVGILCCIVFVGICASMYFYFSTFRNRLRFPKVNSTVSKTDLDKQGYREITISNATYFVPKYWALVDKEMTSYGDLLNGAHAYIDITPNALGVLKPDLCKVISQTSQNKIEANDLFSGVELVNQTKTKKGDYEGCFTEYNVKINTKDYVLAQFTVLRKDSIYILNTVYPEGLQSEIEIRDKIHSSLILAE
jgi:hypothetical protein